MVYTSNFYFSIKNNHFKEKLDNLCNMFSTAAVHCKCVTQSSQLHSCPKAHFYDCHGGLIIHYLALHERMYMYRHYLEPINNTVHCS